jgi:hypothetical protein
MKKPKNTLASSKRAAKKGKKRIERKKIAKKHLEEKKQLKEASKRKEEKIWNDYYNSLMGN